ncbi:MAG: hypothetical protein JWO13_820 [Acidobacteriales bacterium]|nr:hypothetical protein [Terriglobales bacterium]
MYLVKKSRRSKTLSGYVRASTAPRQNTFLRGYVPSSSAPRQNTFLRGIGDTVVTADGVTREVINVNQDDIGLQPGGYSSGNVAAQIFAAINNIAPNIIPILAPNRSNNAVLTTAITPAPVTVAGPNILDQFASWLKTPLVIGATTKNGVTTGGTSINKGVLLGGSGLLLVLATVKGRKK